MQNAWAWLRERQTGTHPCQRRAFSTPSSASENRTPPAVERAPRAASSDTPERISSWRTELSTLPPLGACRSDCAMANSLESAGPVLPPGFSLLPQPQSEQRHHALRASNAGRLDPSSALLPRPTFPTLADTAASSGSVCGRLWRSSALARQTTWLCAGCDRGVATGSVCEGCGRSAEQFSMRAGRQELAALETTATLTSTGRSIAFAQRRQQRVGAASGIGGACCSRRDASEAQRNARVDEQQLALQALSRQGHVILFDSYLAMMCPKHGVIERERVVAFCDDLEADCYIADCFDAMGRLIETRVGSEVVLAQVLVALLPCLQHAPSVVA